MQPRYRQSSDAPPARAWRTHGTLSRARDESGQALAEFAIILPVFLLVLFGVVQFSLAFNAANDQTHVANEVARFAIVNENPGAESLAAWGKKQLYTNYTNALNNEGKVCIRFLKNNEGREREIGDPVEVEVTSTTNWLPLLKLEATSTTIKGRAIMRLEATPTFENECA